MKNAIISLFAVALIMLVGCGSEKPEPTNTPVPPTNTPPTDTPTPEVAAEILAIGDPSLGREIFENGGAHEDYRLVLICTSCHTLDGTVGDDISNGPSLKGIAERAADRVPDLSAQEYIRQSIVDSGAFVPEGFGDRMAKGIPKFLSEEEVDDLVAFLLTQ